MKPTQIARSEETIAEFQISQRITIKGSKMPNGKDKFCFVIMPFQDDMRQVYDSAIRPACNQAGYRSLRADECEGIYDITKIIVQNIFLSDAIIADLTHCRPNVFYEMGVAHAIGNKTIMIIQQDHGVPFDVGPFHCIQYQQTPGGLRLLAAELRNTLRSIEQWGQEANNPVQVHMPESFVPVRNLKAMQNALDEAIAEKLALQKRAENLLNENKDLLREVEIIRNKRRTQPAKGFPKQTMSLVAVVLSIMVVALVFRFGWQTSTRQPPAEAEQLVKLRPTPARLSERQVETILVSKDFYDSSRNPSGSGIENDFESKVATGESIVMDRTTGLTYQLSGSKNRMNYQTVEQYIGNLNQQSFGGFSDWRLPTLEEAMSLMEPRDYGDLYLDPVFDRTQMWIWTADKASATSVWLVHFFTGDCNSVSGDSRYYVRAVR